MVRFKFAFCIADHPNMGPHAVATVAATQPRNVRMARTPSNTRKRLTVVIECADNTCTVIGSDFALPCESINDAVRAVEEMAPSVEWRETTPGFWVARSD